MRQSLFKWLIYRSMETAFAVALVLVFFLGFMAIIGLSFPEGTSLQALMFSPELAGREGSSVELDLSGGEEAPGEFVAFLSKTRRIVKNKRADAISWSPARSGMSLENRHSIQTSARSGATISFGGDDQITLAENSLIVIRRMEQQRRASSTARRASLVVLGGTLDGSLVGSPSDRMGMEFETPGGSSMRLPEGARSSDFKVSINPDKSSTFAVYKGTAEVSSAGKTVQLERNQAVTVDPDQPPGELETLPGRPDMLWPSASAVYTFRSTPPRVDFRWDGSSAAEAYLVEIARDRGFSELVYAGRVEGTEFTHGSLPAGAYYWRVAGLKGWAVGPPTASRPLTLVRDAEPPALRVAFPDGPVREPVALLRGAADPGSEVFVGDRSLETDVSGEFEVAVNLERGLNVVTVEAVDAAGNIAYQSRLVSAKY